MNKYIKNFTILCAAFILAVFLNSQAVSAAGKAKTDSGDKAEALAEEVLQKISDETMTDDEKEKMLDKLKKLIDKTDSAINKKRLEMQKIEEEIKPLESQKTSLNAALDELISYAPRAFKNENVDPVKPSKKDKKSKSDDKKSKSGSKK
jgi:septal ring factor EnvC (AmiA/AmiB activator)